jgi:hypothetical protein
MKNQFLLIKILIRILPDPDPNQFFGSGSCKKGQILSDPAPDPQHWSLYKIKYGYGSSTNFRDLGESAKLH